MLLLNISHTLREQGIEYEASIENLDLQTLIYSDLGPYFWQKSKK
jgi:hypothetical protein